MAHRKYQHNSTAVMRSTHIKDSGDIFYFGVSTMETTSQFILQSSSHFILYADVCQLDFSNHLGHPELLNIFHIKGYCVYGERNRLRLPFNWNAYLFFGIRIRGPVYFRKLYASHPRRNDGIVEHRVKFHFPVFKSVPKKSFRTYKFEG